ncbi:protein of unknown function [Burkholderia multivorans]
MLVRCVRAMGYLKFTCIISLNERLLTMLSDVAKVMADKNNPSPPARRRSRWSNPERQYQ